MTERRIITRAEWGARYSNGFYSAPVPWRENWAHHSVTLAPDLEWLDANRDGVEDDEAQAMRTLEQIGESRFGGGISYTAAVMPSGRIYEGHGYNRQGAHTGGRNDISRAIVFVGNYDLNQPTREQIASAAWLLRFWHHQGWCPRPAFDGGHQQAPNQIATACPGRHVLAAIPEINRLAASAEALDLVQEDDEPMFQHITLPPTGKDEVREIVIGLPWQGGAGGVRAVWATIGTANRPMKLGVAHWRVHSGGSSYPVGMVDDGTTLKELENTGGQRAPKNTASLAIDYTAELGGYVLVEATKDDVPVG